MTKPSLLFWGIGGLSLFWHGFACWDYIMTVSNNEAYLSGYDPELIAYIQDYPAWRTGIWALAVFSALGGSVLLLLRRSLAGPLFVLGTAFFVVNLVTELAGRGIALYGWTGMAFNAVIFGVGIFLIWYAFRQKRLGVLR